MYRWAFTLIFLVVSCDEGTDPITRTFSKTKSHNKSNNSEKNRETEESVDVPFVAQDGTKILSRAALGFKRFGGLRGNRYTLVQEINDVQSGVAVPSEDKKRFDYVVLSVEEKEDCRVTARREDVLSYFPLDCSKHHKDMNSRYFDLGLTPDDLFTYGASDCTFEDLNFAPRGEFEKTRSFKITCQTSNDPALTPSATIIQAWYHPESFHPSGLVEVRFQNCSKLPCTKEKVITVDKAKTASWIPDKPFGYTQETCKYPLSHKRISRCGDDSCFDLSEAGFENREKICECKGKTTNTPVVFFFIPASFIESGEESTADIVYHSTEEECKASLSQDSECQSCFNTAL